MSEPAIAIADAPERFRYEARVGDALAGYAAYRLRAGRMTFTHTEVEPAYEGHGIASALARAALDDARARGLSIVLVCPFMTAYVRRHPEYADLIAP